MSTKQKSLLVQGYEVVIGFETHAQLSTQSKIFSRAPIGLVQSPTRKLARSIWPCLARCP